MIASCSGSPDLQESGGACSLQCSGAIIAGDEVHVRFMTAENLSLSCAGLKKGDPYPGAVPVRFIVERPKKKLPASQMPGETPSSDFETHEKYGIPVSGVSFEASILGGIMVTSTNPGDNRYRYAGIQTPVEEWCTDSCGVGSIEIQPTCLEETNTVTVGIRSGSAFSSTKLTLTPVPKIETVTP